MATDALGATAATAGRGAWLAAYAGTALGALRGVLSVVRPAAWVLIALAILLWVSGQLLGWWELEVAHLHRCTEVGSCLT